MSRVMVLGREVPLTMHVAVSTFMREAAQGFRAADIEKVVAAAGVPRAEGPAAFNFSPGRPVATDGEWVMRAADRLIQNARKAGEIEQKGRTRRWHWRRDRCAP